MAATATPVAGVRGRRGLRRRGNALLEMGIVIMPLLGLLFGLVDFGFVIFIRSTLQHSVREGVRYAVTYQTTGGQCHDASIQSKVQSAAMGFLAGADGLSKIKIRYFIVDESSPGTFTETAAGTGNAPGNVVEVSVENYQYNWLAPIFWSTQPLWINVRSSDRMEGLPAGGNSPCR